MTTAGRTRQIPLPLSLSGLASLARAVEWLPAVTAAAYVGVVVVHLPALVRSLYWDSDAAGALVLGELAPGHGRVQVPRFGWWSSLWWLVATRHLPHHAQLWEATGYVFALAAVVLVGWATWRVAGRWAGITAAAAAIVVGPKALASLLTVNFHTSTPFTAALLGAYLVVLVRRSSLGLALAVGVVAGVNAASDPLLWAAGIAPFGVAAAGLAVARRRRRIAEAAAVLIGVAAACAVLTDWTMRRLGFHVIPTGVTLPSLGQLPANVVELGRSIALLFGANFLSQPTYPDGALRYLLALLGLAGASAIVVAAVHLTRRRQRGAAWAYACYWATGAIVVGVSYCATSLAAGGGPGGGLNYLLILAPASGVGVALLAAPSTRGRVAASLGIAVVGVVNLAGIAQGRANDPSAQAYRVELVRLLEREGLTHGYAPYWDAQSLTWKSGLRVLVAPVRLCNPEGGRALCRDEFFTIGSWYRERPGRSFLVVDPSAGLWQKPPASFGQPLRIERLSAEPDVAVYVYPYDVARHIGG